jgi:very-short-patch-repair endonuclease
MENQEHNENGYKKPRRVITQYQPYLKQYARDLRKSATYTEKLIWKLVRGKFENKYRFHRQRPLDNFIADFYCNELHLVIELDGITHTWDITKEKDLIKENKLNELGINLLRFTDEQVISDVDYVIECIKKYIVAFDENSELIDIQINILTGKDFRFVLGRG